MKRALIVLLLLLAAASEPRPGWIGLGFTAHREGDEQWLVVRYVTPGGPADRAGLRPNDVITRIEDKRIAFRSDLEMLQYLGRIKPGQRLRFSVLAQKQERTRDVLALEMSEEHYRRYKRNVALARN